MGGLDLLFLGKAGAIGVVPPAGGGRVNVFRIDQILGPHADIGRLDLGGHGKGGFVGLIIGLSLGIGGFDLVHKVGRGQKDIVYRAFLTQEVIALPGFGGVCPGPGRHQGKELPAQQVRAGLLFKVRRTEALGLQHTLVGRRVEVALVILEGLDLAHGQAQLQGAHADAHAGGLLPEQALRHQVAQYLPPQLLGLELFAGEAGVVAQQGFFRIAVGHFKIPRRNGLAVDCGRQVAAAFVAEAAHAPEDEDENDDAEDQFDAEGLGIGTDILEHADSEKR